MNSVYSSNNLERCMNSAYIKVVSSIIFDFGFVCCWFYPFWFFEFSVVIRFIIDDSINRVAVAQVFICTPSDPQERPRGFLDSSFIIVILVGCVIRTHRKTNALQLHSTFLFHYPSACLFRSYFLFCFDFVLSLSVFCIGM